MMTGVDADRESRAACATRGVEEDLLHGLFARQVARTPDAVAVVTDDCSLTYRELDRLSNRAAHLVRLGFLERTRRPLPADTPIGLCVERGIEAVVGILAILKAGGAWVPLDPDYPADRLRLMLEDARPEVVLGRLSAGIAADEGTATVDISQAALLDAAVPDVAPANAGRPDDLAYVIYTSGSTGGPKGIMVSHGAILSRFRWMWETFPFTPGEVCSAKTSLGFTDSVWELLGGLLAGVPTAIASEETGRDPAALYAFVERHAVTRLVVVPSLLAALVSERRATGRPLSRLEVLTSSGEALSSDLAREALALNEGLTLLNLYGSTEMSADATCCVVDKAKLAEPYVPIGRPIGDMRIHVLDEALEPCPPGVAGELHISGPGLAHGYFNQPELTAERFIDNPFFRPGDAKSHRRLFRSGDLVRMQPDGDYAYLGRIDTQVKLRGIRVELSEIEATVLACPGVAECAVVAHQAGRGPLLAAYFTAAGPGVTEDRVRRFLADRLPRFMVPPRIVAATALPRLPNGKLDRKALRLPEPSAPAARSVGPRTPVQERLLEIIRQVLRDDGIGIFDDFFAVGGDSLLVFEVITAARDRGLHLEPRDVFEAPVVADLAARTTAAGADAAEVGASTGELPLLPVQQYYFSWAKANPNKFNSAFIARTEKRLDPELLRRALAEVARHHDALRLRFHRRGDGTWRQFFCEEASALAVPVHVFDLSAMAWQEQRRAMLREIERLHDSLDVSTGPVMCVGLFHGARDGENHFFIAVHHLVTDAISNGIILDDLRRSYTALADGMPVRLQRKTTPYKTWVETLVRYANGSRALAQLEDWVEAASEPSPFPSDGAPQCPVQGEIVDCRFEILDAAAVAAVRKRLRGSFQPTVLHALLTAFAVAVHRIGGHRDLLLHTLFHGREASIGGADLSRTVGWLIAVTPVRIRLPPGPLDTTAALLAAMDSVGRQFLSIPDSGLGYGTLRHYCQDRRAAALAGYDRVGTLFQYVGDLWERSYDGRFFTRPAAELTNLPEAVAADNLADYDLHVYSYLMDGALHMTLFWPRPVCRQETVERIRQHIIGITGRVLLRDAVHARPPDPRGSRPAALTGNLEQGTPA